MHHIARQTFPGRAPVVAHLVSCSGRDAINTSCQAGSVDCGGSIATVFAPPAARCRCRTRPMISCRWPGSTLKIPSMCSLMLGTPREREYCAW